MSAVSPPPAPSVPVYPALGSPTFNDEAYTYGSAMPGVSAGIGALAQNAYENALVAYDGANSALSGAAVALASANFKGNYSSLVGALAVPASAYHSSRFWMLVSNVADVTLAVPGVSASWVQIPVTANPNIIHNGDFRIFQRGTSIAGVVSSTFTADRFSITAASSAAVFTASQSTDVPSASSSLNSLRHTVTTADASIATGEVCAIRSAVEGSDARALVGQAFTLSFWFRSAVTGVHCVAFKNSVADRSYVAEFTVSAANTWEKKSITVSAGLITAGTWDWTTGVGMVITWCLCSGSTFQTTANAWQTGNYLATSNQVNAVGTISNIIGLADVKLELGSVATPLIPRPYGDELDLCRRYLPAFLATATGQPVCGGRATSSTAARGILQFSVPARIAPTGVTPSGASHFAATDSSDAAVASTAVSFISASPTSAKIGITTASGLTAGPSNIETNNSAASLLFTGAEL